MHPPVARSVAKVVVPVVALAALAVFIVWRGQVSPHNVTLTTTTAYLGPATPEFGFEASDAKGRAELAAGEEWRLVGTDGTTLDDWPVHFADGQLWVTGPDAIQERLDIRAVPRCSDEQVVLSQLSLTWLGAESWEVEPLTLAGKTLDDLGERSVNPAGMTLEVAVTVKASEDLAQVMLVQEGQEGSEPLILAAAGRRGDRSLYRCQLDDLGLQGDRARLKLVLRDAAGFERPVPFELSLVAGLPDRGQTGLVDGPQKLPLPKLFRASRITRTTDPHLVLAPTRPADASWWIEVNGRPDHELEGEMLDADGVVRLDGLAQLAGGARFTGTLKVVFDESRQVLHASPESGSKEATFDFEYTPDAADAVLSMMRAGAPSALPEEEILYTQDSDLELTVRRRKPVPQRVRVSWSLQGVDGAGGEQFTENLGEKDAEVLTVGLPEDGLWELKIEVAPMDTGGNVGETETTHTYRVWLDRALPQLEFSGIDANAVLDDEDKLDASLEVALLGSGTPGSRVGSNCELRWSVRNLDGQELAGKVISTSMGEPAEATFQLPRNLEDGRYELVLEAIDLAGNRSVPEGVPFEVALAGPRLTLEQPLSGGRWAPGDEGWRIQVRARDQNQVTEVTAEVLSSRDGQVLQSVPLSFEESDDLFERVAEGNAQFSNEQSGESIWIRLVGRDGRGKESRATAVERTLGTIALTIPPRIGVQLSARPGTASMSIIPGNAASPFVFGGRAMGSENAAFSRAGLGRWPNYQTIWAIEYQPGDIPDFYLDEREVTCGEFLAFVRAGTAGYLDRNVWPQGSEAPDDARRTALEQELAGKNPNVAVTDVTWEEASAFATWIGKRLPSWVESEYTVRGSTYRVWAGQTVDQPRVPDGPAAVPANAPRSSGTGRDVTSDTWIRDLCGNVSEWTSSPMSYDGKSHGRDREEHFKAHQRELLAPAGHQDAQEFWIAGGSFANPQFDFTAGDIRGRTWKAPHVGFRCAMSLDAALE
ncbi:MAG: SUMF1/EgtB/PvdO family nonheme iron enzyme, partial [Longimicrobiales bacterium]